MDQFYVFILGVLIGAFLLALGGWLGYWWAGKRQQSKPDESFEGAELLELLEHLAAWTSDYSGTVSEYHRELSVASNEVKKTKSPDINPVVRVLDDIMRSNQTLQKRLDDAERQLDKQTHDIESYLLEAHTDPLTTLPNRRAFDQKLDLLFNNWKKGSNGFVLVMIDIDHFKSINDRYGHPDGDVVLKQISGMLRDNLEGVYLVARFGGEEFAVLMPMPLLVAAQRLDRLRKLIASEVIQISGNRKLDVTISIGLSEVRDDGLIGPIVRRADESLYAAKRLGRNRVYYHDGSQPVLVGAPEVVV